MKKYLVGAATAAMMMAGSANAATIYDLNLVDSGANLGTGPFGTVTVTDQGGGVLDFLVQLAAGYEFRDAADGNHDGFVFGVATKQAAEIGEIGTWAQAIVKMDFSFVPHFVAYQ